MNPDPLSASWSPFAEVYWIDIEDILGKMLSSVMLSISSATLPARSVTLALIDCMIFDVLSRRV